MDEQNIEKRADELEQAVNAAGGRKALAERFGNVTVKLSNPTAWGEQEIREVHLDFAGLTGLDMEIIDEQIGVMGLRGLLPAYSRKYQRLLAARASGLPEQFFLNLRLADYNAVVGAAQNFLLVTG